MPGGLEPISKDNKDVKKYAQLSVSSLENLPGWGGKLMFVEVVEAHSQVVSGTLYHLKLRVGTSKEDSKICNTKVWVQPWLQSEKVTEATCEDKPSSRRKRALTSGLNFGEFQKLNTDDESLQEYAKVAVATIEDAIESDYKLELIRVVDASVRMVSGRMYSLKLEVGHPNCTKFSEESECSEGLFDPKICNVKVWVQDWLNSVKVTDVMCDGISLERKKRTENMLLGGIEPFSVDDKNVLKYANASLAKLDGLGTSEYKLGLKRVVNATVQVVAGISYALKLEVGLSKCPKSDPNPKLDCSENLTDTKMCHVKVWVRDWLNSTEITAASCEDKPTSATRRKRSNIDYEEEIHLEASDETKAKYSDFLQTSLEHDHFPEQESKSAHRLVQINLFSTETPSLSYENEENLEYLNVTMKSLDELTPSTFKLGLIKLIDLRKQIGPKNISLHLKLQVGYTKCPKSEDDSVEPVACAKDLYEPRKCQVKLTITSEPRKIDIESAVCDGIPDKISNRRKRLSISGRQSLNVESEDIQRKSKELLSALSHNFKNGTVLSLNRTVEARVQVVNGALFTYILEVLADEPCGFDGVALFCNDKKDSTHRQVRKYCSVKVLEKEWLKFSEVLFTKCASNLSKLQKAGTDHVEEFLLFAKKHNRSYTEDEFLHRLRIFRANLKKINYLQENEQGTAIYGVNHFADFTETEFKTLMGLKVPKNLSLNVTRAKIPNVELPTEFDWRDHGAVTPVKNQGMCGSCWAFSVTGNIEGVNAIKEGNLISLSEQELVDCDKTDSGCGGGFMYDAYQAIEKLGGLESEDEYPYEAKNDQCRFKSSKIKVQVTGAVNISSDETEMAQWLVTNGPISIGLNANAMQFYMGGVSHPPRFLCSPSQLDHGVLIVGFGVHRTRFTHKMLPYWIVKNSWGPHWGKQGYYLVYRGDGTCGVNKMASSAVV